MACVRLFAAGSLRSPLRRLSEAFTAETGTPVEAVFGPSGLLRERIEAAAACDLFCSADVGHPEALRTAATGAPVIFARNSLVALLRPGFEPPSDDLLTTLLDPGVRVGTSTPGADPSGDYALQLFARADSLVPDAGRRLRAKALHLTGGPPSPPPPAGRNAYAWILEEAVADVFLTYRTNGLQAARELPGLRIEQPSPALAVGSDCALLALSLSPEAVRLAFALLGRQGQTILREEGFEAPLLPR